VGAGDRGQAHPRNDRTPPARDVRGRGEGRVVAPSSAGVGCHHVAESEGSPGHTRCLRQALLLGAVAAHREGGLGSGDAWTPGTIERGGAGVGLAAALAPDGSVALSYATGQQVHVASGGTVRGPVARRGDRRGRCGRARTPASRSTSRGPGRLAGSTQGRTLAVLDVGGWEDLRAARRRPRGGGWSPAVSTTADGSPVRGLVRVGPQD
jgi:hypothetical protein